MGSIYNRLSSAWHDKAEARAMEHPTYAEIEGRRRNEDGHATIFLSKEHGLTVQAWEVQQEIYRHINGTPWWMHAHWFLERHGLRVQWHNAVARHQRARRGWSVRDTWNLDSYLSKVVSQSVLHLKDHAHGHPNDVTYEEWKKILSCIAGGFALVHNDLDVSNAEADLIQKRIEESARLLGRWFMHLWD